MVCFSFHPYSFAISFPMSGLSFFWVKLESHASIRTLKKIDKNVGGLWFEQTLVQLFVDSN